MGHVAFQGEDDMTYSIGSYSIGGVAFFFFFPGRYMSYSISWAKEIRTLEVYTVVHY